MRQSERYITSAGQKGQISVRFPSCQYTAMFWTSESELSKTRRTIRVPQCPAAAYIDWHLEISLRLAKAIVSLP